MRADNPNKAYQPFVAIFFLCISTIAFIGLYVFTLFPSKWARVKAMLSVAYFLYLPARMSGAVSQFVRTPNVRSIIITHHSTAIECAILYHALNPCAIIKREALFLPFLGSICAFTQRVIWINRSGAQLRSVLRQAAEQKEGHFLLFPESTRTSFHAPVKSKSLVYFLAKQHRDLPVVPLVHNAHTSLTTTSMLPHANKKITFAFLETIEDDFSHGRTFLEKVDGALNAGKTTLPLEAPVDALPVHMLYDYMNKNVPLCVIDIRTHQELTAAKLPFAHHVEPDVLEDFCITYLESHAPSTIFALLCHHGVRTAPLTAILRKKGINACNIIGGINAWSTYIDTSLPKY